MRGSPFTCLPHGAIGVTTTGMVISSNFPSGLLGWVAIRKVFRSGIKVNFEIIFFF